MLNLGIYFIENIKVANGTLPKRFVLVMLIHSIINHLLYAACLLAFLVASIWNNLDILYVVFDTIAMILFLGYAHLVAKKYEAQLAGN